MDGEADSAESGLGGSACLEGHANGFYPNQHLVRQDQPWQ